MQAGNTGINGIGKDFSKFLPQRSFKILFETGEKVKKNYNITHAANQGGSYGSIFGYKQNIEYQYQGQPQGIAKENPFYPVIPNINGIHQGQ